MKQGLLEILLLAQHKTDEQLALHAKRVACYASELAILLGLQNEAKKLFIAGLFHDLGFLALDTQYTENCLDLSKEKSITGFENHVNEGKRLMSSVTSDKELLAAIRHHHEKYDGTGFPDQLKANNIPVFARILNIADSYDSLLTGMASSKKRITPDNAIAQITNSTNEFGLDPKMVTTFLTLLNKNPVLLQPKNHNALSVYKMVFLKTGVLEQGDLINQEGTILLKQGNTLNEKILQKIRHEIPGQKFIRPVIEENQESTNL
ncbi:MAG: HD domain-containing protein [Methylococcales bacterium]|nr:HD domain-containing protein [Methylococcales bacterium]